MTALFCPNCGARLKEGQHFCMRCGCDIKEWADVLDAPDALEDEGEEHVAHAQDDRLVTAPQTKGDDSPFESDAGTTSEELASTVPGDDEEERHATPEDVAKDVDAAEVNGEPTDPAGGDGEPTDPAKDNAEARHAAPKDAEDDGESAEPEKEDGEPTDPAGDTQVEGAKHAAPEDAAKDTQAETPAQEHGKKGIPTGSDPKPASPLPVITHDPAAISLLPVSRHHPRLYKEESKAGHRHVLIFAFLTLAIVVTGLALGISSCRSKDFADPQAERVVPGGYHEDTSDASDGSGQSPLAAEKAAKDRERDRQAVKGLYDELAALDEQVSACEAAYDEHYVADRDTRSGDSETATQLAATIQKAQQQAKRANIESRSDYYNQYQLELTCYQYLIERMGLITQMWARNLKYNYPQKYVERLREIRINAIREGETDVAPKVDYNRTYSEISL